MNNKFNTPLPYSSSWGSPAPATRWWRTCGRGRWTWATPAPSRRSSSSGSTGRGRYFPNICYICPSPYFQKWQYATVKKILPFPKVRLKFPLIPIFPPLSPYIRASSQQIISKMQNEKNRPLSTDRKTKAGRRLWEFWTQHGRAGKWLTTTLFRPWR